MSVYYVAGFPVSDELFHYGIIGQKWGVRRWQDYNGQYTEAGKKRYGIGSVIGSAIGGLFSGKSDKKYYTDDELNTLLRINPNLVDYEKVDHKAKGDITEGVKYAVSAALKFSGGGVVSMIRSGEEVKRGAEFVSGLFNSVKYDLERSDNEVDQRTGFKLKDKEYTKEEDLKRVNPDFYDFNTNSKNNCMLCTVTTELRRRGYDVTAKKAGLGYFQEDLKRWFPEVEIHDYQQTFTPYTAEGIAKNYSNIESQMLVDNPEGARGNLIVEFMFGGGHSMFYEIENGELVVRDGQTGSTYTKSEIAYMLSYCSGIHWARLDNVDFDVEKIKECCK